MLIIIDGDTPKMLTDTTCKSAKPKDKPYKVVDEKVDASFSKH
jgi:hypothetical protein